MPTDSLTVPQFIKYVCRVDLRLTDHELLMGDDAIHGEVAYCTETDVIGIVPSASAYVGINPSELENGHSGTSSPTPTSKEIVQDGKRD